ncbi:MAG: ABC transporter ATP-binding protein [Enterococcus sp.]
MKEEPVIELYHVEKTFGKFHALKNVTFSLNKGEVLGFIGPNGAGKSTTIRILLGMLKKDSGTAKIFGKDVWKEDMDIHPRIAYVPGDVFLWPNLTGGQIIDLLLRLNGQERTQKTERLITTFKLDLKKKARTYSKGNRQKVALIAALSQEADVYIFDEPTAGLDPLNERAFQTEIHALKGQGKSILLSSHILSEVEQMCDQVVIIREGEIIETGDLASLRHLTRVNFTIESKIELTDLDKITGIYDLVFTDSSKTKATFTTNHENLDVVLQVLAKKQLVSLISTPPTLEDVFLHYYES